MFRVAMLCEMKGEKKAKKLLNKRSFSQRKKQGHTKIKKMVKKRTLKKKQQKLSFQKGREKQ